MTTAADTIDDEAADTLAQEVEFVVERLVPRLVVDLSTVAFIGDAGLRTLVWAQRYAALIGGDLILVGVCPALAKRLGSSHERFVILPDVASAVGDRTAPGDVGLARR